MSGRPSKPGIIPLGEIASLSGLEVLQRVLSGAFPRPPISQLLTFDLVEVDHGRALFAGEPGFEHYNPIGSVHGGYAATLLDSAMGCAVHSTLNAGEAYTTVEIKVNYVRALTEATGPIRAEGTIIHRGGRIATAEGALRDAAGTLYAHGTTTCAIMPLKAP